MVQRLITLFCLIGTLAHSAVPDGLWNGKPPEKAALLMQVEAGNADAIAEWAYWCMTTYGDRTFDSKTVVKEARAAAKGGSALGHALLAITAIRGYAGLKDYDQIVHHARTAYEAGHPIGGTAMAYVHLCNMRQKKWYDADKALAILKESMERGCVYACRLLNTANWRGMDDDEILSLRVQAYRRLKIVYKDCQHPRAGSMIISKKEREKVGDLVDFPEELLASAEATVLKHLRLGEVQTASSYLVRLRDREPEKHHEQLLELANAGNVGAIKFLFTRYFRSNNSESESKNRYRVPLPIARKMASQIVEQGYINRYITREAANAYRYGQHVEVDVARAIELYKISAECGHLWSLYECAAMLLERQKTPKAYDPQTAIELLTWRCSKDVDYLVWYYDTLLRGIAEQPEISESDRAKGLALWHGRSRIKGRPLWGKSWLERMGNHLTKDGGEIDPDSWQTLVDQDYPFGDRFRRPAFEALKTKGFFPAHADFDGQFLQDDY